MALQADVYAGDLDAAKAPEVQAANDYYIFRIVSDSTPDVLSRLASPFNIANVAPKRASLQTDSQGRIEAEVVVEGISASLADRITRKLLQQFIVMNVRCESSKKRSSEDV